VLGQDRKQFVVSRRVITRRGGCRPSSHLGLVLSVALVAGCQTVPSTAAPGTSVTGSTTLDAPSINPRSPTAPSTDARSPTVPPSPAVSGVGAALDSLRVKGRAPKTGYSRAMFGQAWADVDRNGCDTRNDILARDLQHVVFKPATHDCVVLSGDYLEPYTGSHVFFKRGQTTSNAVEVDHVVALGNAWQTGAQDMDLATRLRYANDPLVLLAVDGPANQQKGDGDTATWLPPDKSFRCAYVARQVAIKAKYHLWITPPEKDAMARVLGACPDQQLPR